MPCLPLLRPVFEKKKPEVFSMDSADVKKIEKMHHDRMDVHQFLSERSKAYGAFVQLAKEAFSDGAQSLLPDQFRDMMDWVRKLAALEGRQL